MVGASEPDPGERGDEIDVVVEAISDKRRRFVLHFLAQQGAPVPLSTLAERLAEWMDLEHPNDVLIGLYHTHLPTLEATGLVSWYDESDLVSITSKGVLVDDCREAYVERLTAACS